jgi:thiamine biosynthesis lipoprotein
MDLCDAATSATAGLFTTNLVGPNGGSGWDPTGLVKGWAVGEASKNLRALEHVQFSINAGGDIVCGRGTDSAGLASPWNIGIEDPADRTRIAHVIPVLDGALATSSAAARGAHIIDPRTGVGVVHPRSTTVTGPDLAWADVWATATFIDPNALDGRHGWTDYRLSTIGA